MNNNRFIAYALFMLGVGVFALAVMNTLKGNHWLAVVNVVTCIFDFIMGYWNLQWARRQEKYENS